MKGQVFTQMLCDSIKFELMKYTINLNIFQEQIKHLKHMR